MKFAAVIGSYDLPDFVRLGILSLRRVFEDIPILVSDDLSQHSERFARSPRNLASITSSATRTGRILLAIARQSCMGWPSPSAKRRNLL